MDPQAHATVGLGVNAGDIKETIYEVIEDITSRKTIDNVIVRILDGFDLVPSNIILNTIEQKLFGQENAINKLKEAIGKMESRYDYIIIDCPPSMGFLTFNALRASSIVIVPVEISFFSLHGVGHILKAIELLRDKTGQNLRVKILAALYNEKNEFDKEVLNNMKTRFKEDIFNTTIRFSSQLKEAASIGVPVNEYSRDCRGFKDYMLLTKELRQEFETEWTGLLLKS